MTKTIKRKLYIAEYQYPDTESNYIVGFDTKEQLAQEKKNSMMADNVNFYEVEVTKLLTPKAVRKKVTRTIDTYDFT